jgi:hypothetical protein
MPQPPSNKKPAVFSVVIRSVDHDITENDVKEELDSLELKIDRIWRIKSMKTNQFTPLIRVTTSETATMDTLITQGTAGTTSVRHNPPPIPVQCSRCFNRGHLAPNCPNRPICSTCPNQHPPNKCPLEHPKCPFCEGNHPVWSLKCPKSHHADAHHRPSPKSSPTPSTPLLANPPQSTPALFTPNNL